MLRGRVCRRSDFDSTRAGIFGLSISMRCDADRQENDVRPVIPNFDRVFGQPILPPDPLQKTRLHPGFFSRPRNAIWWAILFIGIGVSGAALLYEPEVIAEPGCGSGLFY